MNIKMRCYRLLTRFFRGHNLDGYSSLIKLHNYIVTKTSSEYIDVNGYKMIAGKGDWLHFQYTGEYEPMTTKLLSDIIKPGDVVVDVGANIGYYTMLFSRLVGKNGRVFAFEPEPTNYSYLMKNIELNGYTNIITEQLAVSDSDGIIKLFLHETNPGGHTITNAYENLRSIDVKCVTLETYFKGHQRKPVFIKVDVEGAEHLVFNGMSSFIKQGASIVFEINVDLSGGYEKIMLGILENEGYRFLFIDEKNKIVTESRPGGKNVNVLCIKQGTVEMRELE